MEGTSNLKYYIELAKKSIHPRHRHVAIVYHNNKLICWATNNHHQHAEVKALETAALYGHRYELVLVSIAITKGGRLKLAKPCTSCYWYCRDNGVIEIYYSINEQAIVKMKKERN